MTRRKKAAPKQPALKQPAPKQPAPKQPASKQPAPKQPAPKQAPRSSQIASFTHNPAHASPSGQRCRRPPQAVCCREPPTPDWSYGHTINYYSLSRTTFFLVNGIPASRKMSSRKKWPRYIKAFNLLCCAESNASWVRLTSLSPAGPVCNVRRCNIPSTRPALFVVLAAVVAAVGEILRCLSSVDIV
jgi:hypothetical protein